MYLTGSFIVALAIICQAMITNMKAIPLDAGKKTKEHLVEENKQIKIFVLFLMLFSLIMVFVKLSAK